MRVMSIDEKSSNHKITMTPTFVLEENYCTLSRFKLTGVILYAFTQPIQTSRMQHKVNFLVEFNRVEFSFS